MICTVTFPFDALYQKSLSCDESVLENFSSNEITSCKRRDGIKQVSYKPSHIDEMTQSSHSTYTCNRKRQRGNKN
ncbi:hypothetical protein KUTeg_019910 [Tegillarca granosa]|uniref:Uncharacterized protein n=1 Tax=Tegillarca granosa TaxID=220873 RepID=A0ABQ9EDV1_TEGGR|nr:hypothetical protein KUTeg_019910 [Tegillarca granosa]